MARISHKLKNAIEGSLAGGGDPATSPLYVFGPFLKLIVLAGVAQITFGASVWMVVITIAVVSAMYRLVMQWVTDGSGGSGLSEEEFGGWAVKVNAAITFVEYTLTFLVSMAAMVTFIADRVPFLNVTILWTQYRTLVAVGLSLLTGWLVNRGPKAAARTFGPATAGVLLLLWIMIVTAILKFGLQLPHIDPRAFDSQHIHFTINGYARILAVMTGIEVFANLVAAYEGPPARQSKLAFNSLLIVMGTTAVTMLVVGPAIFSLSDPTNPHVSVFTQTMDKLLPDPIPYIGTLVGVAVLMSASAASAQGLQNLALGLRERNYVPRLLGQRNKFEVAERPVWIQVAIVSFCFLAFGTHEETYLSIYAAGVFILLSMTGWAVAKRLIRNARDRFEFKTLILIIGTTLAAVLTTGATFIIFAERLTEGAWTYFIFIPLLYAIFTFFRNQLGEPSLEMDNLGQFDASQLAGFGFGQFGTGTLGNDQNGDIGLEVTWQPDPIERSTWRDEKVTIRKAVVLLDGSPFAALALPISKTICKATGAKLFLLSSVKKDTQAQREEFQDKFLARKSYLKKVMKELQHEGLEVESEVLPGHIADATESFVQKNKIDLVITSTSGKSGSKHWVSGGVSRKLIQRITQPILLVQQAEPNGTQNTIRRILVALDGSINSERTLPYARALGKVFHCEIILLSVPAVPDIKSYRAPAEFVEQLRHKADENMRKFIKAVARSLRQDGLKIRTLVTGSIPAQTIVKVSQDKDTDMIMLTSRGRGGLKLLFMGSVAEEVVANTNRLVLMMPIRDNENVSRLVADIKS